MPERFLSRLYEFQREGIEFALKQKGRLLLADEMGVGKTIQAIGAAYAFRSDWPLLIICPSSLRMNWKKELLTWLRGLIDLTDIQMISKSKEKLEDKKIFIVSYDLCYRIQAKLEEKKFNCIVADESHYVKSSRTKRSCSLLPIFKASKRLFLLTGTPIMARPVEAYSQLNALRPDLFGNFKLFAERYCAQQDKTRMKHGGAQNTNELNFLMTAVMLRRLKKDVLSQLPAKIRQKIEISTDFEISMKIKRILKEEGIDLDFDVDP